MNPTQPLKGRTVVLTRPRQQAARMAQLLERAGASVLFCPAIKIDSGVDERPISECMARLAQYSWVVFTSVNGVERFFSEADQRGASVPGDVSFAAVGPATAEAIRKLGHRVSLIPQQHVGEAVGRELGPRVAGGRVLLARASAAGSRLPGTLRDHGAIVDDVAFYRTLPDLEGVRDVRDAIAGGRVHVVAFTSASTVRYFVDAVQKSLAGVILAAIGPLTAVALEEVGLRAAVVAPVHTTDGLAEAICAFFAE